MHWTYTLLVTTSAVVSLVAFLIVRNRERREDRIEREAWERSGERNARSMVWSHYRNNMLSVVIEVSANPIPTYGEVEAAFRNACEIAPDDDAPRLIYADWLEENGQDTYGRVIRLQVKWREHFRARNSETWKELTTAPYGSAFLTGFLYQRCQETRFLNAFLAKEGEPPKPCDCELCITKELGQIERDSMGSIRLQCGQQWDALPDFGGKFD